MNYFPKVNYNNSNLLDEYYTSYKGIINPFKDNYNYPIEYFDKLHYLRHKLHTEFNYTLLYDFNSIFGKNNFNILKDELSNLIEQLKIEQEQKEKKNKELIQYAQIIEQEILNKELETMSLIEKINTDELASLMKTVDLNKMKPNELALLMKTVNLNKLSYKNRKINKIEK